jgi:hypothetical protein
VTFFNGVDTFALTVCQTTSAASLDGTEFAFTVSDTDPGSSSFSLLPGGCNVADIPIVDASGNPILSEVQTTNALQGSFGNSSLEFIQVDAGPVRVVFDNELVSTGGGGGMRSAGRRQSHRRGRLLRHHSAETRYRSVLTRG